MKRTDIYHIYWGTAGNAGLYLDEIYQVLKKAEYNQKVFVNYYYPFDYGEKVFFKYTELGHCNIKRLRGPVRFLELLWALIRISVCTFFDRPKVINYSLVGAFAVVRYYLWFAKTILGCRIIVTCHDVVGSVSSSVGQGFDAEMINRKKIFKIADYFLVHNDYSINKLIELFRVNPAVIVKHRFPIMDLSKILNSERCQTKECDFLFIGHIRKEKGVDILLAAWDKFHMMVPDATLRVAGNLPATEHIDVESYKNRTDIKFFLKFLSDKEYCRLIQTSRYVIMPYKKGTNSGVVSTVLALNADVIASDIPMFVQNPLIDKSLRFHSEDMDSLVEVMKRVSFLKGEHSTSEERINLYKEQFAEEVCDVYKVLLD